MKWPRGNVSRMDGPAVSLLWPGAPSTAAVSAALSPAAAEDLNLTAIVAAIVGSEGSRIRLQQRDHFVRQTLSQLSLDREVIAYRQAVFRDLLSDPALAARLTEILPQLEELSEVTAVSERGTSTFEAVDLATGVLRRLRVLGAGGLCHAPARAGRRCRRHQLPENRRAVALTRVRRRRLKTSQPCVRQRGSHWASNPSVGTFAGGAPKEWGLARSAEP